jgi:hypothetical protein
LQTTTSQDSKVDEAEKNMVVGLGARPWWRPSSWSGASLASGQKRVRGRALAAAIGVEEEAPEVELQGGRRGGVPGDEDAEGEMEKLSRTKTLADGRSGTELRTCALRAGRPAEDTMAVNAGRNRTRDFSLHNNGKDQLG